VQYEPKQSGQESWLIVDRWNRLRLSKTRVKTPGISHDALYLRAIE